MLYAGRPVGERTAQQMLDLQWMLRRRTWWPRLEVDVCKPGCEKWSGAPLSIKRCDRHKMSVKLFMARTVDDRTAVQEDLHSSMTALAEAWSQTTP